MAKPQFKTLESLKSKKVSVTGLGGTVHIAFNMALEKLGVNPKDFVLVSIGGQQIQQLISLESGYVDAALLSPPVTLARRKRGFTKSWNVRAMVEMPGGGADRSGENDSGAARRDQACHPVAPACPGRNSPIQAKDRGAIVRLLKMDKESGERDLRSVDHA